MFKYLLLWLFCKCSVEKLYLQNLILCRLCKKILKIIDNNIKFRLYTNCLQTVHKYLLIKSAIKYFTLLTVVSGDFWKLAIFKTAMKIFLSKFAILFCLFLKRLFTLENAIFLNIKKQLMRIRFFVYSVFLNFGF